jgi:hypothetical protein
MFLKIVLKSVFLIAIVAVAMIGVMIPNVFAVEIPIDNESDVKLFVYRDNGSLLKDLKTREVLPMIGEFSVSNLEITQHDFYNVVAFHADYSISDKSEFDNLPWDYSVANYVKPNDPENAIYGISKLLNKSYSHDDTECNPNKITSSQPITKKTGNLGFVKICFSVEKEIDELSIITMKSQWYKNMPSEDNGVKILIDTISIKSALIEQNSKKLPLQEDGGCLIATAAYGSEMSPQVQQLRELRDNQLLQTESGTAFMGTFNDIYYSFSPIIADYERENPLFKEAVKLAITPMISSLSLMENAESESEVLSIGISVIMLNLGMYLGIPAIVVVGIRKKF